MSENTIEHFALLNDNGTPQAFFQSDVHEVMPEGVIAISEADWLECLNNQGQRRFVDEVLVVIEPPPPPPPAWPYAQRNQLLVDSDWTHLPDAPIAGNKVREWRLYRQALRELPTQQPDPTNITWPTKPAA